MATYDGLDDPRLRDDLTRFGPREIIVSTLAQIYAAADEETSLRAAIREKKMGSGDSPTWATLVDDLFRNSPAGEWKREIAGGNLKSMLEIPNAGVDLGDDFL